MGLQDRNYQQRQGGTSNPRGKNGPLPTGLTHHSFARRGQKSTLKPWLYAILLLALLWNGASSLMDKANRRLPQPVPEAAQATQTGAEQVPDLAIPGGLILKADASGHFRGTAIINDTPMPFLIDTGATLTVIPENLAAHAGLPLGRQIQTSTAGGRVIDHLTRIERMQLGNAELRNLHAAVNQHLQEVLIGMSTLKHFRITQNRDTLTLIASNDPVELSELEKQLPLAAPPLVSETMPTPGANEEAELKPEKSWKKSVSCDAQKNCRVTYGNR